MSVPLPSVLIHAQTTVVENMLKVEICAHPNRGLHAENIQKKLKAVRKSVGPLDLKVLDTIILSTLLGKYSYVGGRGDGDACACRWFE